MRLIDVDALIDDCKKYLNSLNPSRDGKECTRIHWLIGILSNAPTIEERKKGKWIQFPNHMAYKCSECGRVIQTADGQRNVSKHYPFCHCGADMRKEEMSE